jgi:hypothetical protein
MIRSNLPLPFLYRLRLNASAAARRQALSVSTRPIRQASAAARRAPAGSAGQLWQDFIDRYEAFTGVLCAAAKSGCDSTRESEYALLRRWFVANYYRISGRLRPALEAEFAHESIAAPLIADYAGQKRALDPLEALFLPGTLNDVLAQDTGDLIPHVVRISAAVYQCYEDWEASQSH